MTQAWKVLRLGDKGPEVANLQRLLKERIASELLVDGDFGTRTEVVVRAFQRGRGLVVDGEVGHKTFEELYNYKAPVCVPVEVKVTEDMLIKSGCAVAANVKTVAAALNGVLQKHGFNTVNRAASFIANAAHECTSFTAMSENLNYSAERLAAVWPSRFGLAGTTKPNKLALSLAKNPQAIANYVYGDRMGNGTPTSGDGWKFRGRGPFGLTGKNNYMLYGKKLGIDLVRLPEKAEEIATGLEIAALYFIENGCMKHADIGDFDGTADKINIGRKTEKEGDAVGYADRRKKYDALVAAITR